MLIVYEKYNDHRSGTYSTACIKSTRIEHDVDQEPLAFCTQCYMCKKV
jgi:hypothetical protein